jgi:hypothetical protein
MANTKNKSMCLCQYCISEFKSRGERVLVGEFHPYEENLKCDFCGEVDEVYDCE